MTKIFQDPICGMQVSDAIKLDHKGKTYAFCSDHCRQQFQEKTRETKDNITAIGNAFVKPIAYGTVASIILFGVYFAVLTFVSGWDFAKDQFSEFWFFIVSLTLGFGIQIGLYTYLKELVKGGSGGAKVLGVTGTTSTVAMISCCAHYLVNILPILGVTGLVTFVAQYQTNLFWIGLLFNFVGMVYIANKIYTYKQA